MVARFSEVVPGLLYRGSGPKPEEIPILKEHFGIKHIISLDKKRGEDISIACGQNGIKQDKLYIEVLNPNDPALNKIMNAGATALVGKEPTFVHCWHGKDRTGLFVAKYRVENGMSVKEAVEEAISFGFGIGLDEEIIEKYLDILAGKLPPLSLEDYKKLLFKSLHEKQEPCPNCGQLKGNGEECINCLLNTTAIKTIAYLTEQDTKNLKKKLDLNNKDLPDAVQESRYPPELNNPGDTVQISEMMTIPSNMVDTTPSQPDGKLQAGFTREMRKYMLEAIQEKLSKEAQTRQQITQPIPDDEIEAAENLVKSLNKFIELLEIFIRNPINNLADPLENYPGMTPEAISELKADKYFKNYAKNLKRSIDILTGNLEDKNIDEENLLESNKKSIFNICIRLFSKFDNDTLLEPMKKSLDDSVKGLADLIEDMRKFIEENLDSPKFQERLLGLIKEIQNQIGTIKTLVEDRIIYSITEDILGKSNSSNMDMDNRSMLTKIVTKHKRDK